MNRIQVVLSVLLLAALPAAAQSFKDLKAQAQAQAQSQLAAKLGLPTTAPATAKVYILSPKDGDTVSSPVKVVFGLSGLGVSPPGRDVPATGHHHLLIDQPSIDVTVPLPTQNSQIIHYDGGQTEALVTLKPGAHTLQLIFADWKQQPFNPSLQSDTIKITVK